MNYYIQYDPNTGLVTGWYLSSQTPQSGSYIIATNNDISNLSSASYPLAWTVANNQLIAPTANSELLAYQSQKTNLLSINCTQAIYNGFSANVAGNNYTITLREDNTKHDQTNALMASMAAQGAMQKAGIWSANTTYYPNSVIVSNSIYYMTFSGGLSGNSQPVFPSDFSLSVTDGTIQWYKMGFRISTSNGAIIVDPPTAVSLFEQGIVFVNAMREKYNILKSQVMTANNSNTVASINW